MVKEIVDEIKAHCKERNLDPVVIASIIRVESSFNPFAVRYEPKSTMQYKPEQFYKGAGSTLETERICQKMSFGLGQVLGSTARWLGYRGFLTELCDIEEGIYWCCEAFEKLGAKYDDLEEKIATYNAGSVRRDAQGEFFNQTYVNKVLKNMETFYSWSVEK